LAVLQGELEALQDGIRPVVPETLVSLHGEILRISKLVEDLHLLSVTDSEMLFFKKERMAISSVLAGALDRFRHRFEQHRIRIDLEMPNLDGIQIRGDADRLGQVFTNIFENTCKYLPPDGILSLSGTCRDGFLTLLFQDSGPGVPDEALNHLFDRLYRVDRSRNRSSGGSGLGLSICRHIIENHDGEIWATPSPLGGLTIGIRLPLDSGKEGKTGVRHGG
jgi:two-component system sensor histidine kinase BaeS